MANQYFNITYDPSRQGFSTSTWRLLYGDAAVVGGKLQITKGTIISYSDILRGDATFSINMATPVKGDNSRWGFIQYNKNAYIYFQIADGVLTAQVSNGTNTDSSAVIPWDTNWSGVDTEFGIKWEAGRVVFTIGGQYKTVIDDTSSVDAVAQSAIPGCPLSLYVASDDGSGLLLLDYIVVKGIQSYIPSEGNANSSFEVFITESDKLNITDVPTIFYKNWIVNNGIISENLQTTESVTLFYKNWIVNNGVLPQVINISESVTVGSPA